MGMDSAFFLVIISFVNTGNLLCSIDYIGNETNKNVNPSRFLFAA